MSGPEIMTTIRFEVGDMVFAAEDILNDGGMPGIADDEGLIAAAGTRGVVIQVGVTELNENQEIYLVQFENGPNRDLGNPVGCLPEELTQEPALAAEKADLSVDGKK